MRKTIFGALFAGLFLGQSAFAAPYDIDPDHSNVLFKVKHLGVSTVTGHFAKFSGTFDFDQKNIAASKAEASIDTASVSTKQQKRDDHLRSPDFFDAEKFPKMSFVSKSIKDVQGDSFKIVGDLTLLGITKEIVLDASFGGTVTDPWGAERAGFEATTKLDRKDFGMTFNKVLDAGGLMVGNEVQVVLEIEGIRRKE